ncbi:restriction endonuclease subunit S [Capillibacterium thermochitinicola]|uniref:Restriction endonuclease subunit S n=1 Tax=Capillibacterium thermochitinicola TaxID=2699427 RepID=A0A8J6HX34_9FIRM|nr:restriction endonuclease subunit S [Capillibacterium thermochitinicola]MBA2132957.1 restriction endonuclease subunit S [Capillibacterium thermochitinicola]
MGKWPMVRIGDVCEFIRNGASIKQDNSKKGFPITRIETISNGVFDRSKMGYAGIYDLGKYEDYVLKTGDILMSHINSISHLGKTAYYENINNETIIHGMNLLCLRLKKEQVNYRYTFYYLNSPFFKRQIPRITKKSVNQASFTVTALKELQFIFPPLNIQKYIADTLDKTQEIIDGYKKQLAELDNLIKAVFYEMFGDIRLNKKKWARTKIGEVCHDNIKKLSGNEKIEISYVDISAISNTEKEIISVKNINSKDAPSRAKQILELNDILVSTVRPNLNAVAINNINTGKKVIGSTGFCVLRCKSTINYRYLFEIVKSDYFIDKLVSLARGASYPAVTDYDVKNIDIPIPPLDLQNKFAEIVAKIEEQKALVKQAITESEHLFKSLMSEYFD